MDVAVIKIKPKGPKYAYVDFIIRSGEFGIKVKGCQCFTCGNRYFIKLPLLPLNEDKSTHYSPLTFMRNEDAVEFFRLADKALQALIPLKNDSNGPKIEEKGSDDIPAVSCVMVENKPVKRRP